MMRHGCAILVALLLGCASASAYNLSFNANGNFLHWDFSGTNVNVNTNVFDRTTKAIRFYIGSAGWSATNTAAELNAVRNCFGTWQSVPNTVLKFEEAGLAPVNYDVNTSDNSNVVYWATTDLVDGGTDNIMGRLGVTFTSFTTVGNVMVQYDIALNGHDDGWFTDFTQSNNPLFFIEGPLLHEIGHSLGLEHACIGGATMLFEGTTGVDATAGLSADEVAFARALYPASNLLSTLSALKGTVTISGSNVLGAAVIIEGTNGNLAGGTVTLSNGTYNMSALPPGKYNVRVVPLDPSSASYFLIAGGDIGAEFAGANTTFLPTGNFPVTLTAGVTNTQNFTVTNGTPAFRITLIRSPIDTPDNGNYSIGSFPDLLSPGQSNFTVGVFSQDLPSSGATLSITGDGLTIGAPMYDPGDVFTGLNGISVNLSVASNATPGLRTFIVQQGANIAYANGFLEILPTVPDYNFDGLNDIFQRKYFLPFTSTNAAPGADPDHDGFNNSAEEIAGTDPTNPASFLKVNRTTLAANGTTIFWQSVPGKVYQVMGRTNLLKGTWQNAGPQVTASGPTAQVLDPTATNANHFYRVEVFP